MKLGARVEFDPADILTRREPLRANYREPVRREWSPNPFIKRGSRRSGVIVGVRTLYDGTVQWYADEPIVFCPDAHFTAYLVAFDLRRKPVYLRPEAVTIEEAS